MAKGDFDFLSELTPEELKKLGAPTITEEKKPSVAKEKAKKITTIESDSRKIDGLRLSKAEYKVYTLIHDSSPYPVSISRGMQELDYSSELFRFQVHQVRLKLEKIGKGVEFIKRYGYVEREIIPSVAISRDDSEYQEYTELQKSLLHPILLPYYQGIYDACYPTAKFSDIRENLKQNEGGISSATFIKYLGEMRRGLGGTSIVNTYSGDFFIPTPEYRDILDSLTNCEVQLKFEEPCIYSNDHCAQ